MRLTRQQVESICRSAETAFGAGTLVKLFGSRIDDSKLGGDIDLLVRPAHQDHLATHAARRLVEIVGIMERRAGEQGLA